jgi:hypothetical protein
MASSIGEMATTDPRLRRLTRGQLLWLVPILVVNSIMVGSLLWRMAVGFPPVDWRNYVEAADRFRSGGLYDSNLLGYAWHYSPVLAPVFGLLAPIGDLGWRLLHLVPVVLMPTRLLSIVVLVSWPFVNDVESGNVMIFVLLAAAWAVRGSRAGSLAFLALAILVPRPLMLPLAAWLLWRRSELRLPFVAIFAVHAVAVALTGGGPEWVADLLKASRDVDLPGNIAPSRFIGPYLWLAVGIPVAIWLTLRDRPEWAGMFVQPYLIGYYLLLPLASLGRRRETPEPAAAPPAGAQRSPAAPAAGPPAGG